MTPRKALPRPGSSSSSSSSSSSPVPLDPAVAAVLDVLASRNMTAGQLIEQHTELEERVRRQQQQHAAALAAAEAKGEQSAAHRNASSAGRGGGVLLSPEAIAEQAGIGGSAPSNSGRAMGAEGGGDGGGDGDSSGLLRTAIGGHWRDSVMEPRNAGMVLSARCVRRRSAMPCPAAPCCALLPCSHPRSFRCTGGCACVCLLSTPALHCSQNPSLTLLEPPPFESAARCRACNLSFGLFSRRHHCRHCGMSFCDQHSRWQTAIPYYGLPDPVRCCEPCVKIIRITTRRNSAQPMGGGGGGGGGGAGGRASAARASALGMGGAVPASASAAKFNQLATAFEEVGDDDDAAEDDEDDGGDGDGDATAAAQGGEEQATEPTVIADSSPAAATAELSQQAPPPPPQQQQQQQQQQPDLSSVSSAAAFSPDGESIAAAEPMSGESSIGGRLIDDSLGFSPSPAQAPKSAAALPAQSSTPAPPPAAPQALAAAAPLQANAGGQRASAPPSALSAFMAATPAAPAAAAMKTKRRSVI